MHTRSRAKPKLYAFQNSVLSLPFSLTTFFYYLVIVGIFQSISMLGEPFLSVKFFLCIRARVIVDSNHCVSVCLPVCRSFFLQTFIIVCNVSESSSVTGTSRNVGQILNNCVPFDSSRNLKNFSAENCSLLVGISNIF